MRRRRKILIATASTIAVIGATTPIWLPMVANLAEPTIRRQVLAIASELLKPRVEVGRLNYSFPLSVDIVDLRLIGTDEKNQDVVLLDAPRVGITLDRLPILAGPLVFRNFELENVKVQILAESSGSIVGWADLLADNDSSDDDSSSDDRPVSEIFSIDRIAVDDLTLEYALIDNPNRMVLDKLDFVVDNKGKKGTSTIDLGRGPGWYAVDTVLERKGLFEIKVDGGLDIDSLVVELASLDVDLTIDEQSIGFLPPQFQGIVKDRQVRGSLDGTVKGTFSLDDPRSDKTNFSADIRPTSLAIDDYLVEIDKAKIDGRYQDEVFLIDPIEAHAFDGVLKGTVRIADEKRRGLSQEELETLKPPQGENVTAPTSINPEIEKRIADLQDLSDKFVPTGAFDSALEIATGLRMFSSLDIDKVQLSKIHRTKSDDPQKISGELSAGIETDTNLGRPLVMLGGGGQLEVVNGRFTGGPLVTALSKVMRVVTLSATEKDWLVTEFTIRDERIQIQSIEALAGPIGARGRGWIGFNGQMDLELNGGPLEGLQATAGKIGQLTGLITDRFAKYVVTGPIRNPSVKVAPFGIRLNRPK